MNSELFVGFFPDQAFDRELKNANPYLVEMLTSGEGYLQKIESESEIFLGKKMEKKASVETLENSEQHLLSLLRKLTPNYSFSKNPPLLVTIWK